MQVTALLGLALAWASGPLVHGGARWLAVAAMVVTATLFVPAIRVGASQEPGADEATTALLEAASWTLVEYLGPDGAIQPVLAGTEITATFREGRLGGSPGRNSYGSTYTVNGGALALSEVVRTLRLCTTPTGVMEQEAAYLAALQTVRVYRIEGNRLILETADGAHVASFIPANGAGTPDSSPLAANGGRTRIRHVAE